MSLPKRKEPVDKSRGLRMSIPQGFADMMACCLHSQVDALNVTSAAPCGQAVRTMGPFYLCERPGRQRPPSDLAPLCRLMLVGGFCGDLDPHGGHERIAWEDDQ